MLFLHLCIKSELEEQRSHKVVTVKSIEFDLLLLVSLQCDQLYGKEIKSLPQLYKLWLIYNPNIFATQCCRPTIIQTINYVSTDNLSLKYQRFTPSGCKVIGKRILIWVCDKDPIFFLNLVSYLIFFLRHSGFGCAKNNLIVF